MSSYDHVARQSPRLKADAVDPAQESIGDDGDSCPERLSIRAEPMVGAIRQVVSRRSAIILSLASHALALIVMQRSGHAIPAGCQHKAVRVQGTHIWVMTGKAVTRDNLRAAMYNACEALAGDPTGPLTDPAPPPPTSNPSQTGHAPPRSYRIKTGHRVRVYLDTNVINQGYLPITRSAIGEYTGTITLRIVPTVLKELGYKKRKIATKLEGCVVLDRITDNERSATVYGVTAMSAPMKGDASIIYDIARDVDSESSNYNYTIVMFNTLDVLCCAVMALTFFGQQAETTCPYLQQLEGTDS